MFRTQCVLALVAMYVGLAHSWDIAVGVGDQLIFYTNGSVTNTVNLTSHNLTALAYDEVHNMMLYVDKQSNNDSICGYDISSKENKCFIERNGRHIHGLAFDPATESLFFSDTNEKSINQYSLKPGARNNVYGNLLFKLDIGIPTDIAVDSCRGFIYWMTSKNVIKKAPLNGSEKDEQIYNSYSNLFLSSIAIDPQTREIYFTEGLEPARHEFVSQIDFNGRNESLLFFFMGNLSPRKVLTVSKDFLYWMNSSESDATVWQVRKNNDYTKDVPTKICTFNNVGHIGIAANYKIIDQNRGIENCKALPRLISDNCDAPFCVHGMKDSGESLCQCTPGYIGERCDVTVCENYCFQGNCNFNEDGRPKCRCNAGYSGERCEVYACHGYCLNNGVCSLNEKDEPVCQCVGNHKGSRCEADISDTFSHTASTTQRKRT